MAQQLSQEAAAVLGGGLDVFEQLMRTVSRGTRARPPRDPAPQPRPAPRAPPQAPRRRQQPEDPPPNAPPASQMMAPEEASIQQATRIFEEMKRASPDRSIQHLVVAMRQSQQEDVRSMSSVLLRKMLIRDDTNIWPHLDAAVQESLKKELLAVISSEAVRTVRMQVEDLVSELAAQSVESGGWNDLQPFLFQALQSGQENVIESALRIFADLANHGIVPPIDTVVQMLTTFIAHPSQHVRLATVANTCSVLCNASGGKDARDVRERLQVLVPKIMEVISWALNNSEEETAQDVMEHLIEVAEEDPRFFRKQLVDVTNAFLQVANAEQLDEPTRRLAAEFLITLCEAREKAPGMMRKLPDFLLNCFNVVMVFLLDIEEDEDWGRADTEDHLNAGEGDLHDAGKEYLDRLSLALGGNSIAPIAGKVLPGHLAHGDWKHRQAGLMALAQIAEGCAKVMSAQVSQLVGLFIGLASDPHPRVRWAFCQTMGQMCTDLGPALQKQEHARIMPAFFKLLGDQANPRVQAHASAALVNFSEEVDAAIVLPYCDTLIPQLLSLIQSGPKMVQEGGLTALASVADCAGTQFGKYYDAVVPILVHVIQNATAKEYRLLRAKALECVSLVGMAVGKERFMEHAQGIMGLMKQVQESNLEPDDPLLSYMQQAWTRVCKCLGRDFLPYMHVVMPPLIASVGKKPNVRVLEDDQDVEGDEDAEIIDLGTARVVLSTTEMEEIATASNMVYCYVEELKDGFAPWVEEVTPLMLKHLTFYFHDEVRRSAIMAVPELVEAAFKAILANAMPGWDQARLKGMTDRCWGEMVKALEKEPEPDVRVDLLCAIGQMVEEVGPAGLVPVEMAGQLVPVLAVVMDQAEERRQERTERRAHEDFDEEEEAQLAEEQEVEEAALDAVQELLAALISTYKGASMPIVEALLPKIARLMEAGRTHEERRIAVCVFDDLLEHAYEAGASRFTDTLLPLLVESCKAPHAGLRQCAVYALGLLAERAPERGAALAPQVAQLCLGMMADAEARSEDNEMATDNAVAALGKVIEHWGAHLDAGPAAVAFLDYLPLSADEKEAHSTHARLQSLVEASHPAVLGANNANLPRIVKALVSIISAGTAAEGPVVDRMCQTLVHLKAGLPADVFGQCAAGLSPPLQQNLAAVLSNQRDQIQVIR